MSDLRVEQYLPLFEAVSFATRAHQGQMRKDGVTPYVSHPFRVALVVREVFGIDDISTLIAAILHDTVEDTRTDYDDVEKEFGPQVAQWVSALSKDKRQREPERERDYEQQLAAAPWQVKVCKLADIFDNLTDSINMPAEKRGKVAHNARRYLDALASDLPEQARRPWQIVSQLLANQK
jgi:guanosine-3',5'-bis(diphosphate) 3'-pyrophosphohydrolase